MDESKNKIAIISFSLGGGGAERFSGLLGIMLEGLGYEIHNITINDAVDFPYTGKLYNLGKMCKGGSPFVRKWKKNQLLRSYLNEFQIDIIIDNRSRNHFIREFFAQSIYGKRRKFPVVHNFRLENYFPKSKFLAQLLYKDAEKIICVSKAIERKVFEKYGFENTQAIYNPVSLKKSDVKNKTVLPSKFILFFGRIDDNHKNLMLLLDAFSQSKICLQEYQLVILGDGPDKQLVSDKIEALQLCEWVKMIPYSENPFEYVKAARFTVLSSRYEGFPMSIIESLACGTPVVSVDCKSGPNEIIQNRNNGLLVPNHNSKALSEAISQFVEDDNLYDICKQNAVKSVAHLSIENISAQWQQILSQK